MMPSSPALARLDLLERISLAEELERRGLWDDAQSAWRAEERRRCARDPAYFIDTYCMVEADTGVGVIPFHLYDYQRATLAAWIASLECVMLKARQLGVTELAAAYALWQVNFHLHNKVIVISQDGPHSKEFAKKVRIAWDHLPSWLRQPLRNPRLTETLELANGSRILPQVATEGSARGLNCQLLILDEFAHQEYGRDIFQAASITARSAGNKILVISTAHGAGDIFHEQWLAWENGEPGAMHGIFLPWDVRPGRDQAWYERNTQGMETWFKHQEFPATPATAFALSGRGRFDMDALTAIGRLSCSPPARTDPLDGAGMLQVWEEPVPGNLYVCGADTAEGLVTRDYDAAVILDHARGVEAAALHGHWEPLTFAHYLARLCRSYNCATLAVERNTPGPAVLLALTEIEHYPTLYQHTDYDQAEGARERVGWPTNTKTKPIMIAALALAIMERRPYRDAAFIAEARTYAIKDNGATGASGNLHDDRVMAMGIAEQVRQHLHLPAPATYATGGQRQQSFVRQGALSPVTPLNRRPR